MKRQPNQQPETPPLSKLQQISTHWSSLHDPLKFVMTYGTALRKYLLALLRQEADAEDVLQDLLLQMTAGGFAGVTPDRGRFRDYLKAVARNAARKRLRQQRPASAGEGLLEQLPGDNPDEAEQTWLAEWRQCVLDKAWRGLERHQHNSPGNLSYTVLRLTVDYPEEDSPQLAARAAAQSGQPLTPAAFRKQLSRTRRRFAELIVEEVRQTLEESTPERVQEELAELGLLEYLREFLAPGEG